MNRTAALARRALAAAFAATLVLAAQAAAQTTTIVIVRHAEKADEPAADPPLTEAGRGRAAALVEALRGARVDAIYSTQYRRTRETVQPLAEALGIPVTIEAVERATAARHPQLLAERVLAENPGGLVVVAGHSNTVPSIIEALGAGSIGGIEDDEYDGFYVVVHEMGEGASVIRSRYGD